MTTKLVPAPGTPLSACIISFNEEDRIADCVRSLAFCDEVVVVDSRSTDRTREIAAECGARVIERDWPGHVDQKEFTIRAAEHDWVLCIDSDERISQRLREEIIALKARNFPGNAGWRMPRLTAWLGRWIDRGTWYPDRQLRLFDRRRGHWGGNNPHDKVVLEGSIGALEGDLLHHAYRDLDDHISTITKYTEIMARGLHERGRKANLFDLMLRPGVRFFRFYFLKLGFLLGWRGLALALLAAWYVRLKYVRLYALQRAEEPPQAP